MSRLGALSGQDIIKALSKLGYSESRRRSSHIRLVCAGRKSLTIPDYKEISQGLLRKILRDAELSLDNFSKLLN